MAVYSYYYGASPDKGIAIQAQSPELEKLSLVSDLKSLSGMHALDSSEHSGEMLSYLLEKNGYSILGLSYMESPKSSGYSRSAPCSLQYIAPMQDLANASAELGKIINFVNFQKPGSPSPAPLSRWPMNESGYSYHNSADVLAPLVDGLARVALSEGKELLLIALPKIKNSEYAFARYTMAELITFLPAPLRPNIRFFTGLPVTEGVSDPTKGFDNAVRFGANVIFCPNEYFSKLTSYRKCIAVNMEAPGQAAGPFADFITRVPDPSAGLAEIDSCLSGKVNYDNLNRAAQQAKSGHVLTLDSLRRELEKTKRECRQLESQIDHGNQAYGKLQREYDKLLAQSQQNTGWGRDEVEEDEKKGGVLKTILLILLIIVLMAASAGGTYLFMKLTENKAVPARQPEVTAEVKEEETTENKQEEQIPADEPNPEITEAPAVTPVPENTELPAEDPGTENTEAPEENSETEPSENQAGPQTEDTTESSSEEKDPDLINMYMKVNHKEYVNLRNECSKENDNNIIDQINYGECVWGIRTVRNSKKEEWCQVKYHKAAENRWIDGYMLKKYLTVLSQEENEEYLKDYPAPDTADLSSQDA